MIVLYSLVPLISPSGSVLGIRDVDGHEKLVRNPPVQPDFNPRPTRPVEKFGNRLVACPWVFLSNSRPPANFLPRVYVHVYYLDL